MLINKTGLQTSTYLRLCLKICRFQLRLQWRIQDFPLVHALATCSATVNLSRAYSGFNSTSLLFGTGCVDGSGSLSGGAFNQLKCYGFLSILHASRVGDHTRCARDQ